MGRDADGRRAVEAGDRRGRTVGVATSSAAPDGDPMHPVPAGVRATRLSATWTGVVVSLIILVVLVVFIAENTQRSTVSFFGLHGSAPVSVMLLIAAVAGALVVVGVAAARLLQLRLAARRAKRAAWASEVQPGEAQPGEAQPGEARSGAAHPGDTWRDGGSRPPRGPQGRAPGVEADAYVPSPRGVEGERQPG